jgi:predicted dehydrogenase
MPKTKKPIAVAIIGCGDIAGRYDERKTDSGVFSHAMAYKSVPGIKIASAFDTNAKRLNRFCEYWGVEQKASSFDDIVSGRYDIISVCTPDATHERIVEKILRNGSARYVWVEKPLATSALAAEKLIKLARKREIGLWLTNQRRWEPCHAKMRELIRGGGLGELVHATGYYVKGMTHIGCTLIDTLRYLCGDVGWVRAYPPFNTGSYGADHSLVGALGFVRGGSASIVGCDKEKYIYSIFEIDIMGTHGRIRITSNGDIISIYNVGSYGRYSGFGELRLIKTLKTEMKWSMKYGAEKLIEALVSGRVSDEYAKEGLTDLRVVDAFKRSARRGGVLICL